MYISLVNVCFHYVISIGAFGIRHTDRRFKIRYIIFRNREWIIESIKSE